MGSSDAANLTASASGDGATPGPADAPVGGIEVFRPDVPDFVLVRVSGKDLRAGYPLNGPAIAICTAAEFAIDGRVASVSLGRGESVYITPDEATLSFAGEGELFLATTGE